MKIPYKINEERLWTSIFNLAEIGTDPNGGNTRLSLSDEDRHAREYILRLLKESGLEVKVDEIGNIIGTLPGEKTEESVVMTGSHIDTVKQGGKFDGALGVIAAIEVLRTLKEHHVKLTHSIEVVSFTDEEGTRFGTGFIGSRGMIGSLTERELQRKDENGITYFDAFDQMGIPIRQYQNAIRPPSLLKAYIEMHIEQGRILETRNIPVGIVTKIQGGVWMSVTFSGKADHAGATPMSIRYDPSLSMAESLLRIEQIALKWGGVATVGKMDFQPCGANIIPNEVTFSIDFRHTELKKREVMEQEIITSLSEAASKRGVGLSFEMKESEEPVTCTQKIINTLNEECENLNIPVFKMVCGAGHDALVMSKITDIGMILVRSKDGISHNSAEWSSKEDCVKGTQLLLNALVELAR